MGTTKETMMRILLAAIVAVAVFGVSGLVLSKLIRLSDPGEWEGTQSKLRQLTPFVDQIIEEEVARPKEERVNFAIEAAFDSFSEENRHLQEGSSDSSLHHLAEEISNDPSLGSLGSPLVFVEKDNLPNGFGFYWKGEDGLSKSGGMDPDDINSWDFGSDQFYQDRTKRKIMLQYCGLAMIPALVVFALLIRMTGNKSFRDGLGRIVKNSFLWIGIPIGLLVTFVLVVGISIFGSPFSSSAYFTPSWKSELPSTATEVYEEGSGEKLIGDYSYRMRAKVTEEEFINFCKGLEMTLYTEGREYEDTYYDVSWSGNPEACGGWWVPTNLLGETFVWQKGHTWSYAKYEDGYLYFKSFKH